MSSYSITEPSPRQKWSAGVLVIAYALITIMPLLWIIAHDLFPPGLGRRQRVELFLRDPRARPDRIAGMVTIAAAPDFTEDGYWASFTEAEKAALDRVGHVERPSDYMEPYIITKRLIDDGRQHLVLRTPLALPFPVRCLQGTADTAVSIETALRLLEHADCPDMRLTLVKDADHRFSDEMCLGMIEAAVAELSAV